jgi:hypothetical protein
MKKISLAAGFACYLLGAPLSLALLLKFLRAVVRWDFLPLSVWPLGLLSIMTLSLTGYHLVLSGESAIFDQSQRYASTEQEAKTKRSYRWGRFQGALNCGYGLFVFVASIGKLNISAAVLSVMCILGGFGILTKRQFGFALFYITFTSLVLFGSVTIIAHAIPDGSLYYTGTPLFFLYWFVPAVFYYPKRREEFR